MKKNIDFVSLNLSLLTWLTDQLQTAPPEAVGAEELRAALFGLADGSSSSLMIEIGEENEERTLPADQITCGELTILIRARKVLRSGTEIALTPKEFDILCFLARNRGEVFTKEQIYRAVWADEYMLDDSNIMAFIRKLRKKIEPSPDSPIYILTVWGIGYKFNDKL